MGRSQGSWGYGTPPWPVEAALPPLYDPPSHPTAVLYMRQDQAGPESTGKLREEVTQMPTAPALATPPSYAQPHNLWPHEEFPMSSWMRRRKTHVWFTDGSGRPADTAQKGSTGEALQLLAGHPGRTAVRGSPPNGQTLEHCTCLFTCLGRAMGTHALSHVVSRQCLGPVPPIAACAHHICELISEGKSWFPGSQFGV